MSNPIASLDVDAQNCFTPLCPDELPVPEGNQIVEELNAQAKLATLRIGAKDAHPANAIWVADEAHPQGTPISGKQVDCRWKRHAVPGEFGFAFLTGLPHPTEYDYFIWKGVEPDMHPYGACYHDLTETLSTGLIEYLKQQGVQRTIVGGLTTDFCVKTTVIQLLQAGFDVVVNLAACRGIAVDSTRSAITEMQAAGAMMAENAAQIPYYYP